MKDINEYAKELQALHDDFEKKIKSDFEEIIGKPVKITIHNVKYTIKIDRVFLFCGRIYVEAYFMLDNKKWSTTLERFALYDKENYSLTVL